MGKPPVVPHGEVALCAFVESSCHALTVGSHLSLPLHGGLPPSPHREEATHHSLAMGGLPPCHCEVGQYRIQPLPTAGGEGQCWIRPSRAPVGRGWDGEVQPPTRPAKSNGASSANHIAHKSTEIH
ncbi:Os08g0347800 [Oryza sativa Japonica Group]|uniref:Os08g0347800 protein n=1 Tax=Oryza sativa subsp. japonica TaxID=39947 RepID=A0A0P0XF15_ORYSJ|nr:Os08g0347800 [Oryza sativa Japonica Group]